MRGEACGRHWPGKRIPLWHGTPGQDPGLAQDGRLGAHFRGPSADNHGVKSSERIMSFMFWRFTCESCSRSIFCTL